MQISNTSPAIRAFLCLVLLTAAFIVMPACAEDIAVSQKSNLTSVPLNGEVLITISIEGMKTGGITEEIPPGFVFAGTDYPAEQYRVSGQNLIISVIENSVIKYKVRADKAGTGTFTGTWTDFTDGTGGTIPAIMITAGSAAVTRAAESTDNGGDMNAAAGTAQASGTGGGACIVLLVAALVICTYAAGPGRRR